MSNSAQRRLLITAVLAGQSQSEVARTCGVSQGWISPLMARYRRDGEAAFEPGSRRPKSNPKATPPDTAELIIELRKKLAATGLDAGPDTIGWHLHHHHQLTVSRATIARHPTRAGLVVLERDCPANGVSDVSCSVLGGRHAVGEGDRESVQCWFPAYGPTCLPGPGRVQGPGDELQGVHRRLFVGEVATGPDRAAVSGVERLDRVGRADQPADLHVIVQEGHEL